MSKWLSRARQASVPFAPMVPKGPANEANGTNGTNGTASKEANEDGQADVAERAAVLEYDEGLPRAEAERLAQKQNF
ncbi:hypothetical protein [Aurantimonas sp. HBX-1]|uniref:hypothetical protein n=1 Tax=Aurantimonas sp. HBX-1 TaxID=2906072 RepID=UPI001F44B603|nr:hypothetical protein [Aurantimonas sp. HBX-1]UIJ72358.1 hypothetical protein LXB15_01435 [Aurantimonas sp. HBX-1]